MDSQGPSSIDGFLSLSLSLVLSIVLSGKTAIPLPPALLNLVINHEYFQISTKCPEVK